MVLISGGIVSAKMDTYHRKMKAKWVIGSTISDILVQKVAFLDNFERIIEKFQSVAKL